jgi:benzodiazapine receptor
VLIFVGLTVALFTRVSRAAAALMVPYWAWTTFAAALNFAVWQLNP